MSGIQIDVFTVFPKIIEDFCSQSLIEKAQQRELLKIAAHDLRSEATGVHKSVDDAPFGGGAGMVLKCEPVFACVEKVDPPRPLILMSPAGRQFNQKVAAELAELDGFSMLCGRYEGVDERITTELCDDAISIGDFVLAGGEVAALAIIEAVTRLRPGVMGNSFSAEEESFSHGLLEYPQYTRPASFRGMEVPDILRSGNHEKVRRWRLAQSLAKTIEQRPELLEVRGGLSESEIAALEEFNICY